MIRQLICKHAGTNRLFKSVHLLHALSTIVLFLLLVIIGIALSLQFMVKEKDTYIYNMYSNTKFYAVRDNFYDPNAFHAYRESSDNINKLGQFYNALSTSDKFKFISAFAQPIPVENFKGSQQFFYNSQEFRDEHSSAPINVKSIQLNNAAFNHFSLVVEANQTLNWSEINYRSGNLPIYLGSNYKSIYKINDKLKGNFYGNEMVFTVCGFLAPNSFISYKGNAEFYLDDYMVMPYPVQCKIVNPDDFKFEGIMYFAMINGEIVSKTTEKDLITEIKHLSDETRFIDFSIIGLPEISVQYRELLSIIYENQKLLYFSLTFILILVCIIQFGIGQMMIKVRKALYKSYWMMGYTSYFKYFIFDLGFSYLIALVLCNVLMVLCFQSFNNVVFTRLLSIAIAIFAVNYVTCRRSLLIAVKYKL